MPTRKHRTLYFLVVLILGIAYHVCFADVRCTNGKIIKYNDIALIGSKIEISSDNGVKSLKYYEVRPSSLPDDIREAIVRRLISRYKKANKLYATKKYSRAARYYRLIMKSRAYFSQNQIKSMEANNIKQRAMGKFLLNKQWVTKKEFEESQKAKGLVFFNGQWISETQAAIKVRILKKKALLSKKIVAGSTRIGIGIKGDLKPFRKLSFGVPNAENDEMSSLAFSPDGKWIVGGGKIRAVGTLRIWNKNGRLVHQKTIKNDSVRTIRFSANSMLMAHSTGEKSREVWIWDTSIWKRKRTIRCLGIVMNLALSPDGKRLVTSTTGKNISIWDIASGRQLHLRRAADVVVSLVYSPSGKYFASGTRGEILIWDDKTGSILRKLKLPEKSDLAANLAYSSDGKLLAEAGSDGMVRLWDISSGRIYRSFDYGNRQICFSVAISPDSGTVVSRSFSRPQGSSKGDLFLAALGSGGAELWDVKTGRKRARAGVGFYLPYNTCSLAFSPDGQTLAVATNTGINLYR